FAQNHEGTWDLTGHRIRTAHNAAITHGWVLQQNSFDLRRSNRESLVLDHLLAPIDDPEEALVVPGANIAGPVPSIAHYRVGCVWILPIALHELRTTHYQFARLSGGSFRAVFANQPAIGLRDQGAD